MYPYGWLISALSFPASIVLKGDKTNKEAPDLAALLERARRADPDALAELYDRYVDRIYSYVYHRVSDVQLAEDLTGQVFMRMLEAVRAGRGWQSSFSGWLYRIAHNLVIDHYRRRQRAKFVELEEAGPLHARKADPAQLTETQLDREQLRAALALLTEEQAQVITLRFIDELSITEAADIMGKNEGAIKALQYRAVMALKRVMQP